MSTACTHESPTHEQDGGGTSALFAAEPRRRSTSAQCSSSRASIDGCLDPTGTGDPGSSDVTETATDLPWPSDTFSLSRITLPFSPNDPVYGRSPDESLGQIVRLGLLSPRGERALLVVPMDVLMLVSSTSFYSYLEEETRKWVERR